MQTEQPTVDAHIRVLLKKYTNIELMIVLLATVESAPPYPPPPSEFG